MESSAINDPHEKEEVSQPLLGFGKENIRTFKGRFSRWWYPVMIAFILIGAAAVVCITLAFWNPGSLPAKPKTVNWYQKGMTFTNGKYCPWTRFATEKSEFSLRNLATTGATHVAIVVTHFQDNINTTDIYPTTFTATDLEVISTIVYAHKIGLQVMLKPQIDLYADPDHWRGDIGTYFTEEQWDEWFAEYTDVIIHYASIAQAYNVSQFSLGCELINTSPRDAQWRGLAENVRLLFTGNLTYAANWGGEETNKTWWDAVDIIGVDAYYPICQGVENATVVDLIDCWQFVIDQGYPYMQGGLRNLSEYWNKTIIFTEVGYCSGDCVYGPGVDLMFQLTRFEAVFDTFRDLEWFDGVYWWNWVSDPAFGGEENYCMTPQFKPTEELLRSEYGGTIDSIVPDYEATCACIL